MSGDVEVGRIVGKLELDSSGMTRGMAQAEGRLKSFSSSFSKEMGDIEGRWGGMGKNLASVLSPTVALAGAVGGLTMAFVGSTQASIGWQSTMADVAKTAGASTDVEALGDALLTMSTVPGMPVRDDLADIATNAGALGVDGTQNVLAFTESIAMATTAFGGMSAGDVASNLAKMENVFGISADQSMNLAAAVDWVGNNLAATEAQVMPAAQKMSGLGAMYGMTATEALGLSGSLIDLGMQSDSAGTLTSSLMTKLSDPTSWEQAGELIGMTADEFGRLATSDIDEAMLEIAEALEQIADPAERAQAIADLKLGTEAAQPLLKMVGHTEEIRANMEGTAEAFEDTSGFIDNFGNKADTSAASISSIVAQVGVIAVKFGDVINYSETFQGLLGDVSGALGLVIDNMDTITGLASHLGEDISSGLGWLYEASPLGEIGEAVGAADEKWNIGDRIWGAITEYAGTAGEEAGDEFAGAVDDEVVDAAPEIGENLAEGMDGEKSGKSFGDTFNTGLQEALRTGKPQTEAELQYLNSYRQVGYDADASEKGSATFTSGGVEYTYQWDTAGSTNDFDLYADGRLIATLASIRYTATPSDLLAEADIPGPAPGSADWYDMLSAELAQKYSKGGRKESDMSSDEAYAIAFKMRLEPDLSWQAAMDRIDVEREAFQEMMDGLSEAYHDAFDEAMGEGVIIDWATAWEDAGEMAADAFSDNLISGVEARDVAGALQDLKILDPAAFEEMGGEAALEWWQGLSALLEQRADMLAVDINADTTGIDLEISAAVKNGEPYLATIKATVGPLSPIGSAFENALWWEDYGGSDVKSGLGEFADDMEMLGAEAAETGGLFAEAYEVITNPWGHEPDTVANALDYLWENLPDGVDPRAADAIANYFIRNSEAGIEQAKVDLRAMYEKENPMMSWFGYWQENTDAEIFSKSYIGETAGWAGQGMGGKAGYENFFTYDVTVDTSQADAAIAAMEAEAESTRTTPIDADISPALAQNEILEAELSAPVTKTVYIETVGADNSFSSSWGNADWHGAFGVEPGNYSSRVLSFANEGVVSTPTRAIVGDAPVPEAVMRIDTLYNFVQQAVESVGAAERGGGITINLNVTGGITSEVWPQVERAIDDLKIELSNAYVGRHRGGR